MKKIYGYVRESTIGQNWDYQLKAIQDKVKTRTDCEIVKIFKEKISGFKTEKERPEMHDLLNKVKSKEIDENCEIFVYSFERLSRDAIYLMTIVRNCIDNKVNIHFIDRDMNTLNSKGKEEPYTMLIVSILGQFAEWDVKSMRSKSIEQKDTFVRQSKYVDGMLPLGYTYDYLTKKIQVDEKQRKIVELIFKLYVEGMTMIKIANLLNTMSVTDTAYSNIKTLKGIKQDNNYKHWSPSSIRYIIRNSFYAGTRIYKSESIKLDNDLIIIDSELFNRANNKLQENKINKTSKYTYILNHKIYCNCGKKMRTYLHHKKRSYVCETNIINKYNKNCKCNTTKIIQIDKLESIVWNLIEKYVYEFKVNVEENESKIAKINEKIKQNKQLINTIEDVNILNLNEQRKRTIKAYTKYGGDENDFNKDIKEIDKKIKEQNNLIDEIKVEIFNLSVSISNVNATEDLKNNIEKIRNDKNLIKSYVDKFIKKITYLYVKDKFIFVFKLEWNDNVNNDSTTYLFYNSHKYCNHYYLISSADTEKTDIIWNKKLGYFTIVNKLSNNNIIDVIAEDVTLTDIIDACNARMTKDIKGLFNSNIFYSKEKYNVNIKFE